MKSFLNTAASALVLLAATAGVAHANEVLPEPSSIALVGLGLAAAIYIVRRNGKK